MRCYSPLVIQCVVVLGASVNMSQVDMVMGYAAVLVPQLQAEDSEIAVDDSSGSWIGSVPGFSLMVGNLTMPPLMAKFGRRISNIISVLIVIAGWSMLLVAQNITWIIIARLLQGLAVGMSSSLIPTAIAEYPSPKNRGVFTILMSLVMAAGNLTVHTVGSYVKWKTTALVITIVSLVDLLIVALSPETPSWLAEQGRLEECKKVFRLLRGDEDIEELERMIQASVATRESRNLKYSSMRKIREYVFTMKKKEFYKPIIITLHLYTMAEWAGINVLVVSIVDIVHYCVGKDANIALIVISVDVQRLISSVIAVYFISRFKRRTMLFVSCGANAMVLLVTSGYTFAKAKDLMPDNPMIGVLLIHALMVTVSIGSLPLPYTIAGEIFAVRYRSLSSGISSLHSSINIFLSVKTFTFLSKSIGIHGAYCVYAGIVVYCLIVVWFLLPETKDRTLHDIEDELKGKLVNDDILAAQALTVFHHAEMEAL